MQYLQKRWKPLLARESLSYKTDFLCVTPLRLGGLRGKKSTPSIGWEVSVKSFRLADERKDIAQVFSRLSIVIKYQQIFHYSFGYGNCGLV
jgi:hypothetical protein